MHVWWVVERNEGNADRWTSTHNYRAMLDDNTLVVQRSCPTKQKAPRTNRARVRSQLRTCNYARCDYVARVYLSWSYSPDLLFPDRHCQLYCLIIISHGRCTYATLLSTFGCGRSKLLRRVRELGTKRRETTNFYLKN